MLLGFTCVLCSPIGAAGSIGDMLTAAAAILVAGCRLLTTLGSPLSMLISRELGAESAAEPLLLTLLLLLSTWSVALGLRLIGAGGGSEIFGLVTMESKAAPCTWRTVSAVAATAALRGASINEERRPPKSESSIEPKREPKGEKTEPGTRSIGP